MVEHDIKEAKKDVALLKDNLIYYMGTSKEHIKMKILVVGSEGFLGTHVTKELKNDTSFDLSELEEKKDIDIYKFSKAK